MSRVSLLQELIFAFMLTCYTVAAFAVINSKIFWYRVRKNEERLKGGGERREL